MKQFVPILAGLAILIVYQGLTARDTGPEKVSSDATAAFCKALLSDVAVGTAAWFVEEKAVEAAAQHMGSRPSRAELRDTAAQRCPKKLQRLDQLEREQERRADELKARAWSDQEGSQETDTPEQPDAPRDVDTDTPEDSGSFGDFCGEQYALTNEMWRDGDLSEREYEIMIKEIEDSCIGW